ncbi:D-lyxose/D-mannose family sugar isomerase [Calidithermus timidus]|jgi:D-lyxose ketol-isomerase|uniref:D-lyxose/D-mannose family sugar isomerase n=1 Tax=Calidithermus timidus TaxID=307124 RepID=UPI000371500F|nr:D-lyxose/D-mannose family sugar isomerase [Calidithermus timidus]
MKRSEINRILREGEAFLRQMGFFLPPFAHWSKQDWAAKGSETCEIIQANLGWDLTDFGLGEYEQKGVLLFTLRNGSLAELGKGEGQVYCEKILICKPNQLVLHHFHWRKTEDIINRGGGKLEIVLHQADANGQFSTEDVRVRCDGIWRTVSAGGSVILSPGESITLRPYQYHQFRALEAPVLVGEVSTVNDDHHDNHFYEAVGRFPTIEEDEEVYRFLVGDYPRYLVPSFLQ